MKKYGFLFFAFLLVTKMCLSAPGDTTKVVVYKDLDVNAYGDFDTTVTLPSNEIDYSKIRMLYTLGRKSCPPGTEYCGAWDYTTGIYAQGENTDNVEVMRVITPYASNWPTSRTHTYVKEVTDYLPILNGEVDFTYLYEGYSWGFTLTLEIEYIEGNPPRKAVDVKTIYNDHYDYGVTSNPINEALEEKTFTYNGNGQTARIENIISGHGADNTNCAEFCKKWYKQLVNGEEIAQYDIWKNDCGANMIDAQTGTWIYDRANWCPGEQVESVYHDLSEYTSSGEEFSVKMDFQPYTTAVNDGYPMYNITSNLIIYEQPTYEKDASITEIIAPTNDENYAKLNPICNSPIVKIRNEGKDELTSVKLSYHLDYGGIYYYDWKGSLGFMEEEIVELPPTIGLFNGNQTNTFNVNIVEVNGEAGDENPLNDHYQTEFKRVDEMPEEFRIKFKTNSAKYGGKSQTEWKILNSDGEKVYSRENNEINTEYIDTIQLDEGCYTFIATDYGCDGMTNFPTNAGNGLLRFIRLENQGSIHTFTTDFGCETKLDFTVGYVLSTEETNSTQLELELFPNPANNIVKLSIKNQTVSQVNYSIYDINGREVKSENELVLKNGTVEMNTKALDNGMYFIHIFDADNKKLNALKKVVIQK